MNGALPVSLLNPNAQDTTSITAPTRHHPVAPALVSPPNATRLGEFFVRDYDLAATLACGQAFRWQRRPDIAGGDSWTGVVNRRWVRLCSVPMSTSGSMRIQALTAESQADWHWLTDYLQLDVDLAAVLATFPDDQPIRDAVNACRGLRLLRQESWECLASFICSSTKQIVQIQQIVSRLCDRFGEPSAVPAGEAPIFAFPSPQRIAAATEAELRGCLMGFRAPYLKATAEAVATGTVSLKGIGHLPLIDARAALTALPGVGRKVADCVLLFAYGVPAAFPMDVWVLKALRELYFPKRRPTLKQLQHFSETYFGPHGGYAQQYLFHYMRQKRTINHDPHARRHAHAG